jgi:hypothetical protein
MAIMLRGSFSSLKLARSTDGRYIQFRRTATHTRRTLLPLHRFRLHVKIIHRLMLGDPKANELRMNHRVVLNGNLRAGDQVLTGL